MGTYQVYFLIAMKTFTNDQKNISSAPPTNEMQLQSSASCIEREDVWFTSYIIHGLRLGRCPEED